MERNWDLLRDIMGAIEKEDLQGFYNRGGNNYEWKNGLNFDQIAQELHKRQRQIDYHVRLLIDAKYISWINSNISILSADDANYLNDAQLSLGDFVEHQNFKSSYKFEYADLQLSMAGHDLLTHMRSPKVWNKILEMSEKATTSLTVDFLRYAIPKVIGMLVL